MKTISINVETNTIRVFATKAAAEAASKGKQFIVEPATCNFDAFQTSAILAMFNNLTGESVARFSTRAAGIARLHKAIDAAPVEAADEAPAPETKPEAAPAAPKVKLPKEPKPEGVEEKAHVDRSAAIAESWKNPDIAAKRSERHGVRVDGKEYNSVRQAFVALNLPISEHIKFRMELKAASTLTRYGKTWFIIER